MSKVTVADYCASHSWPTEGGLRWLIFNRKVNGFDSAFIKVGRRILIDLDRFDKCLDEVNGNPLPTRYDSANDDNFQQGYCDEKQIQE